MSVSDIQKLFNKSTTVVEASKLKVGNFIKFIDYDLIAEGVGEIQMIQQSRENAPLKVIFKSAVMKHNYIMLKPKDKVKVLQ